LRGRIFLTIKQIRGKKAHLMQRAAATATDATRRIFSLTSDFIASVTCNFQEMVLAKAKHAKEQKFKSEREGREER